MQLKALVLPAPLGPIKPTISHSLTRRLSPSTATRPPKRIVRSWTSSTDTAALHRPDAVLLVLQTEGVAREPGHGAGDGEPEQLVAEDVDADGRRDLLVVAERHETAPDLAPSHADVDVVADRDHRKREQIEAIVARDGVGSVRRHARVLPV